MIGYRKVVVHQNLINSFPEKSREEIAEIEEEYFRHLCDLLVESIKTFTISYKSARKRFVTRNPELPDKYYKKGKSIALVGGHYGNWELFAVTVDREIQHKTIALYTSLTNKFFDKKMRSTRSRFGLYMLPVRRYREAGISDFDDQITATIFGSDQCPRESQKAYWMRFLNQDTAVQFGVEKFARKNDFPVLYGEIHKIKRGYYEVRYELVCEEPNSLPVGKISEIHTKLLEKHIIRKPHYWLWSHKRWKLPRPEGIEIKK